MNSAWSVKARPEAAGHAQTTGAFAFFAVPRKGWRLYTTEAASRRWQVDEAATVE
jgi:hypothetical protein